MRPTLAFVLILAHYIVSIRKIRRGRYYKPFHVDYSDIGGTINPYQEPNVKDIESVFYNIEYEQFRFEDDILGQKNARIFDKFFKDINKKFTYIKDKLLFDLDQEDLEDIKKVYTFPTQETALAHLDILAARWFVANNGSVKLTHVINRFIGKELIYPVYTYDNPEVFDYDISKNPVLPIRLNETPSDYARRIESFYRNDLDEKLKSIINKKFFDLCYMYKNSQRFRNLGPGTQCGKKITKEINHKIRFTASSLVDIHFDSSQFLSEPLLYQKRRRLIKKKTGQGEIIKGIKCKKAVYSKKYD